MNVEEGEIPGDEGDVVHIPPAEHHQSVNRGDSVAVSEGAPGPATDLSVGRLRSAPVSSTCHRELTQISRACWQPTCHRRWTRAWLLIAALEGVPGELRLAVAKTLTSPHGHDIMASSYTHNRS
jgi:hypothetical protein